MLVLPAKIYQRTHAFRQLTHACQASIDAHATAPVGRKAPANGKALGIGIIRKKAALNGGAVLAIAHLRRIGALTHQELKRREQGAFARAGLAGKNGQPGSRFKLGLGNKREILNVDIIDHGAPHRRRGSLSCKSSRGRSRARGYRPHHAEP